MNKVIVRIIGGLGNQLFCYAAARRLAVVNDAELIIDDVSGFKYDKRYRRKYSLDHFNIPCRKATPAERLEPFPRIRRYIIRRLNQYRPFDKRRYIKQEKLDFDERLLNLKFKGTIYLEGYWQSCLYFKDVEDIIRKDLEIRPPTDKVNLSVARQISKNNAVACHVRFFDPPESKGLNNLVKDYYFRAVKEIERRVSNPHYFVFSDHPDSAQYLLPLHDDKFTLVSHNNGDEKAFADLWLMTKCKHFIIANSTFSWWGAWLSEYSGKHVIAPDYEMQKGRVAWGFSGLLPDEWIRIKI